MILYYSLVVQNSHPAFKDLKRLGVPLLLVDAWTDLNVSLLEAAYEQEFRHVDWARARRLLSPAGVMDMLLSWNESIPMKSQKRFAVSKKTVQYYLEGSGKQVR